MLVAPTTPIILYYTRPLRRVILPFITELESLQLAYQFPTC